MAGWLVGGLDSVPTCTYAHLSIFFFFRCVCVHMDGHSSDLEYMCTKSEGERKNEKKLSAANTLTKQS